MQKKQIVITGTSRGIGLELALLLAHQGHNVLCLSRKNKEALLHPNIQYHPFDLGKPNTNFPEFLKNHFNTIDVLIHNAGSLVNKPFEQITQEDFLQVYQTNVFGVAQLTQWCLPYMPKGSHVVTISSMGGVLGTAKFPGLAAYSSSKGAVITLSELLAEEYRERGIAFNVLALGAVQTEMLQEAFPGYQAPVTAPQMASFIAQFALTGNQFFNGKVLPVSLSTP
jgi:NAD(P)-dependent dehydrogenase (short-subunit alcohol dehydrogenase family)